MPRDIKEERLRIIDYLISNKKGIGSIEALREAVNSRVKDAKPLNSNSAISNLLTDLRKLIPDTVKISDPRKDYDGYRYSDPDYSYFKDDNEQENEEKLLLLLANSLFSGLKDTPLQEEFNELAGRIFGEKEYSRNELTGGHKHIIQVDIPMKNDGTKWLKSILRAIQQKQSLRIQYEGYGKEEKTKRICPYVLKEYLGSWYMVAYDYSCERLQKTNLFALDCINDIKQSKAVYYKDPFFDAQSYFKYSIGVWHQHESAPIKVRLEFSDERDIDYIRTNPVHHSQKRIDSSMPKYYAIQIVVYETPELIKLIQSYGSRVKVLAPDALAEKINASAQRVVDLYNEK